MPPSLNPSPSASSPALRRPARARRWSLLLFAALLAACGGADDPPPSPPAAAAPPPVASFEAPDPAWLTDTSTVAVLGKALVDQASASRGWAALAGSARCDVTLHAILHPAQAPDGSLTSASGAVLVPGGPDCPGPYPVVSYARGTDLDRDRTLARPDDRETQALAGFFAARGYVVVATDYLGYARSAFPWHPYLQAESQARTQVEAIRAGAVLLSRLGVATRGRLMLAGYSQGGHAALAAQRAIERDRPAGVPPLVASGAMSGPYDLPGSLADFAATLPRWIAEARGTPLAAPVELRLGGLFRTETTEWLADRDRLRETLQTNSVIGWQPVAPVLLCGGARDPVVPFGNTTRAAADFTARGSTVTVVDVDREPAYAPGLPPPDAGPDALGRYHQGQVPPACFAAVRDRLFEPLR